MASPARVAKLITLEEFLQLPEIDEHPYLEMLFHWLKLQRPKSPPPSQAGPATPGESS
jgi:hypothetical protein